MSEPAPVIDLEHDPHGPDDCTICARAIEQARRLKAAHDAAGVDA